MQKIIKRIASIVIAACLVLSGATNVTATEMRFPDIVGHWAEKYVDAMAEKGIISGMGDGLFHPDLPVTTSQFVTMIIRTGYGYIAPIDGHWASGYLDAALKQGVATQYDVTNSDRPLIRLYAARIGHEAMIKIFNEDDEQLDWSVIEKFNDDYSCDSCAVLLAQLYVKGIMRGRAGGQFFGEENLTRAEAAVVIMKILEPSLRDSQTDVTL